MSERKLVNLRVTQLDHHPENVRKYEQEAEDVVNIYQAQLVASIAAHGLLHGLVVVPHEEGAPPYLVVAGGRRLEAVRHLMANETWSEDASIPCLVVHDLDSADVAEISLAENKARHALSVADEIEAFSVMMLGGSTAMEVAERFGYSERIVMQRVKLASAHPDLRERFRKEELSFNALCAFAVMDSQQDQIDVWNALMANREDESIPEYNRYDGEMDSQEVGRFLDNRRIRIGDQRVTYAGLEAYKEAGGGIETDLFGNRDHTYLLDEDVLNRLVLDKLAAEAQEKGLHDQWAWVEPMIEFDEKSSLVKGRKVETIPTDEESAQLDDLKAKREACWDSNDYETGRGHSREIEKIEKEIRTRDYWADSVRETAGCVVTIGFNGEMRIHEGLWREDEIPEEELKKLEERESRFDAAAGKVKKTKPKKGPHGLAQKPLQRLRELRTDVIRAHLTAGVARQLLEFELVREVFGSATRNDCLDIRFAYDAKPKEGESEYEPLAERIAALETDWLKSKDPWKRWQALSQEIRDELVAAATATLLRGQLSSDERPRPGYEEAVRELDIDWTNVRPTADMLWSRLTKPELLKLARKLFDAKWVKARQDLRKSDLVDAMAEAVEASKRKSVQNYSMPGFAPKKARK